MTGEPYLIAKEIRQLIARAEHGFAASTQAEQAIYWAGKECALRECLAIVERVGCRRD